KVLFWMHLIAGCVAGAIVLVMSVTGVMLTYERQMLARADRGKFQTSTVQSGERLNIDDLVAKIQSQGDGIPRNASLVLRSDPKEPAEVSVGRGGSFFVN